MSGCIDCNNEGMMVGTKMGPMCGHCASARIAGLEYRLGEGYKPNPPKRLELVVGELEAGDTVFFWRSFNWEKEDYSYEYTYKVPHVCDSLLERVPDGMRVMLDKFNVVCLAEKSKKCKLAVDKEI